MASSKEDGTAAVAAQQVSAMSLNESSAEGKDDETESNEEAAEENEAPTKKMCSACEKKSDALKKCTACKCVWYCDTKCQNKHWKEHKKECKRIKKELDKRGGVLDLGTEMDIGPLGKVPPREECPICMLVLPIHNGLQAYSSCCGKTLCSGCTYQHEMKSLEQAVLPTCAFCRTAVPKSGEEALVPLRKRVELKDPRAMLNMAMNYGNGDFGVPVDQARCIELLRESAVLGFLPAQCQLGNFYDDGEMGLEQNEAEALKYWKKAAEGGDIRARNNLACTEAVSGDLAAAMRHWRLAASGGFKKSMEALINLFFEDGLLHHADLAETLQVFYHARAEMKSEDRDKLIEHLKNTGEYRAEYEC